MSLFNVFAVCFVAFYIAILAAVVFGLPGPIVVVILALGTVCVLDLRLRRVRRR